MHTSVICQNMYISMNQEETKVAYGYTCTENKLVFGSTEKFSSVYV